MPALERFVAGTSKEASHDWKEEVQSLESECTDLETDTRLGNRHIERGCGLGSEGADLNPDLRISFFAKASRIEYGEYCV